VPAKSLASSGCSVLVLHKDPPVPRISDLNRIRCRIGLFRSDPRISGFGFYNLAGRSRTVHQHARGGGGGQKAAREEAGRFSCKQQKVVSCLNNTRQGRGRQGPTRQKRSKRRRGAEGSKRRSKGEAVHTNSLLSSSASASSFSSNS
jgi:hypothetical protein